MRILTLTRYERLGSSSRVRFYQYFPYLKAQGVDIVNEPFFSDAYVQDLYAGHKISLRMIFQAYLKRISVLTRKGAFDLIWLEKELLPWFPAGIEALFRERNIPYAVDYDDAVFHRYDMHPIALTRALLGKKIDNVMRHVSMVIVGNEYLAERARRSGARSVEYLPSVVDVNRYALKRREADTIFRIGWIGSPVTAPYLGLIREAIDTLHQESDIRLVLVGAGITQYLPGISTEILPWNEDSEFTVSQKFDVGIMPLIDGPFERGKCGYKLIQYMAGGVPVVASPVGVNRQIVEPDVNGYLADSMDDWLTALRALRDDPHKRNEMGQAGRQKAEKLYNLQVTAPKLLDLLSSVAIKK
jgi:glycosyltransferase involved in cell wall biosynthesis